MTLDGFSLLLINVIMRTVAGGGGGGFHGLAYICVQGGGGVKETAKNVRTY